MIDPLKSDGNRPYALGKGPTLQGGMDEWDVFLQVLFISNICDPVNNSLPLGPCWLLARDLCQSPPRWPLWVEITEGGSPTRGRWFWKPKLTLKVGEKACIPGSEPRDRGIWTGSVSAQFLEAGRRGGELPLNVSIAAAAVALATHTLSMKAFLRLRLSIRAQDGALEGGEKHGAQSTSSHAAHLPYHFPTAGQHVYMRES